MIQIIQRPASQRTRGPQSVRHIVTLACIALALAAFSKPKAACARQETSRPNVVLIMTDDQGYGDLSITGNTIIDTPHMDRIGKESVWFKRFYVSPVCTPTRAHLMTGRYNYRTRAIDTYLGRAVMEPDEVTVAELLGGAGYATGIFGKWHLGDYYPARCIDQGFQEALVHRGGGLRQPSNPPDGERYHDPILFHNGQPKRFEGYCTDIYFDQATQFIEKQAKADKPFFAYISTNAPHGPFDEPPTRELMEYFQAKLPDDKRPTRACFYAMIKNIDNNIGRLLESLKRIGVDEDTIVIFLTDNGPAGGGSSGPFRAAKGSVYEGGIRTVCFVRWPGVIVPGSQVDFTAAHIDLMPTILDFCEVAEPDGVKLDGRSLRVLIPEQGVVKPQGWPDRHLFFQWHRGDVPDRYHHFAAVDPQGKWKLVHASNRGREKLTSKPDFELFNLHEDIGEQNDLADQHPEIVARLKQAYDVWFDDVCSTRDPNFGMPPIVIGSDKQSTVVLTPQDKRVDAGGSGWRAPGHWPVDVRRAGTYTINVLLTQDTPRQATVDLKIEIAGKQLTRQLAIPRGADAMAIGDVTFPATGQGKITARVESPGPSGPAVYQITIK